MMASQAWIAERAVPLLKDKPQIGAKELKEELENRILSCLERTGKATRQVTCKSSGELGHRATSWRCPLTGTKKRYVSFAISSVIVTLIYLSY